MRSMAQAGTVDPRHRGWLRWLGVTLLACGSLAGGCGADEGPAHKTSDCYNAGCALCVHACTDPCGCCPCSPGSTIERDGKVLTCDGKCYGDFVSPAADAAIADANSDARVGDGAGAMARP